jgi:cobalt transporter subunit CbtA
VGIAAYVCIDLAPALGLPPRPPGVPVADLYARQIWWVATVISTAIALWLFFGPRKSLMIRLTGLVILILPHAIGAPAATGDSTIPGELIHRFTALSILTTGIFWIALGSVGGLLYQRSGFADLQ